MGFGATVVPSLHKEVRNGSRKHPHKHVVDIRPRRLHHLPTQWIVVGFRRVCNWPIDEEIANRLPAPRD